MRATLVSYVTGSLTGPRPAVRVIKGKILIEFVLCVCCLGVASILSERNIFAAAAATASPPPSSRFLSFLLLHDVAETT